jgi:uncharacterized membrane protein YkoI
VYYLKGSSMSRLLIALAAVSMTAASANAATAGAALKGHELSAQTKVTLAEARVIALKARPGKITAEELEKEAGGTGLRYSFDVKSQGKEFEVGVDAVTGKVLENGSESLVKEAKEAVGKVTREKR